MRRIGGFLLAMFIATAGVVFLLYKNELGRMRDAVSRGGVVANLDMGPVEYADSGAGIPLLSIHGAGGGFDQGLANAADLVGKGFRVIAPSRFGYLRTPVPQDTSPAAQADAHAALLSKLDVPKAVVVGVSAGARSAVELTLRHPDKVTALILIVPGLYSPTSPVSIEASRGNKFVFRVVNAGGDFAWWATEKIAPSVLVRFLGVRPALVAAAPRAERNRVMSIVKSVEPLSLRFPGINIDSAPALHVLPLEVITAPTIIISARDDLFNTLPAAEFAAAKIPRAKLVVYDTGGHLLVGQQQDVRMAVRTFLVGAGLTPSSDSPRQ
ncbi:MAG: alpha/beta hydrolase [Mesorhizobium sp.]|uniref:alpha/beta fold hydrolase n=1 Tax=Mesorhizobium sp. TaxID=1871066 RepID=UPI000FE6C414|nr:alpha/beta hydrolase [Mesorhizobium sp.]RWH81329.1 MAG: alpha/beta hydrolase [Mesorhizobium sp.]RWH85697.1 MAG: alpha/beta hydrolase [Mesorhizobium sp.]RWH90954.1 MAG: alpha/beta hydrolase [Mesorhizobium sp.]RWH99636.1 MAG: alpha/beta hydrolase [Mesorhizobium sp.]RWI22328.1 MAG: alpha/beta hydrolase [Mesorhizobium sp.]